VGGAGLAAQVSVVVTVKNEGESVDRLLESLCSQTQPPDEVVIVDGGSNDDTLVRLQVWEQTRRLPLHVLVEPGCNISRGRNMAICAAQGPIIASTDAGVRLDTSWLANLLKPFGPGPDPSPAVACGFFRPDATTAFEIALGATTLPTVSGIDAAKFLPSSRSVAFLKSAWEATGGYPEWLDYCEDLIFDFRLRARGYRFVFVPDALVCFRPRSSLRGFFTQYYRYARGDGKADLWRKRHAARYLTYLLALPAVMWLALTRSPAWAAVLLVGAAIMLATPYKRLLPAVQSLNPIERLKAIVWVPIIRVTGDIAKMAGYPVGVLWRWRHRGTIPRWRD